MEFMLRADQVISRNDYIKAGTVDTSMFNAENQRSFWVFTYGMVDLAAATTLLVESTTNMSFTGDATVN